MGWNFVKIPQGTKELSAIERLEKSPSNGRNVMTTLLPSFLDGFSSFLQVPRTTIKVCMSLNFVKIPLPTTELAAFEHLKNQ